MAQEILNSSNNLNIPHVVSGWFDQDWGSDYVELGDLRVNGVSLTPEFYEHRSYRQSINSLRKRMVAAKNASITMTLNEPNILNLQRVLFGGTIASGDQATAYEGRHLVVRVDANGEYVDLYTDGDQPKSAMGNITVVGLYQVTDVSLATNLLSSNLTPDTDGHVYFDATDVGADVGSTVYVRFNRTETALYSSEIFGASNATVEGAGQIQCLNDQGGVLQIWDLASVHLAPNGDITLPLDSLQEIPLIMTLQERLGTYGTVYTK